MREKIVIPIILFVLLILVALFLLRPKQSVIVPQPVSAVVQATNQSLLAKTNIIYKNAIHALAISSTSTQKLIDIPDKRTLAGFQKYIESKNSPIEFYGKVIDQDSNALTGAKIRIGIRQWYVPLPGVLNEEGRTIHLEQTSDANGRFEFNGATGDGFGIGITKSGYELEPNRYGFGPTAGSYESPIVFKMWSTNVHEHLISGKNAFHIVPDGRLYFINLSNGTISESGTADLKVWVKRPEQITYGKRYNWSCEVDVMNGGLQSAPDYAMYLAPPDGYVPAFQFEQAVGSGWGDSTGERQFYVTLNNGQEYGHITIELYAYYNNQIPAMVSIQYTVNPSGSRILR